MNYWINSFCMEAGVWLALSACMTALAIYPTTALAQTTVAHVEGCTKWDYRDGRFGTVNDCREPATIQFMLMKDERMIERVVGPGEFFDTGLGREQMKESGWLFTACPVGYQPSVPISLKNKDLILPSLYNCAKKPDK